MSRDRNPSSALGRRTVLTGLGAAALAGLSACARTEAPVDEEGRVRLRLALDGPAEAGHGGYYQALASGAYERRNLNIEIIPGAPDADVPRLLAAGAAEIGVAADNRIPLRLVAEGAPVKAVAAFFQKAPRVLMAHPAPDLDALAELADRPVIVDPAAGEAFWAWLKARHGFADAQARPVAPGGDPVAAFLADPRAVLPGRLTSSPYTVQAAGVMPRVFLLADEGYPAYGGLVLAPNAFARDNAQALRAFIAASVEGWRDYIHGDAEAGDALIRRANPDMDPAALDQGRERLRVNGVVDGADAALYGLGAMTEARWRAFFEITVEGGAFPADLAWRDAFTGDYLPARS